MERNYSVPIPQIAGKIFKKTSNGRKYVDYEYASVYIKEKGYSIPKRKTIGKVCPDDSSRMYPNDNYYAFFPDEKEPEVTASDRSLCLKTGTYFVIEKILHEYKLQGMLHKIIGEKYGLFLDLISYSLIEENNANQYYPDYAFNHPLFTKDMQIYSDSSVCDFLHDIDRDQSILFLNQWNAGRNKRDKIYISYDSTNKKCEAGDIDLVETGHSKSGNDEPISNYAIAYDENNREPLFYEDYPGSIVDISQLDYMVDKALGYGYKDIGFILDRGYFSKGNIHHMDQAHYSWIIMMKGMKPLAREVIKTVKGRFEQKRKYRIDEYHVSGTTVPYRLFPSDEHERYFHVFYNDYKAATERNEFETKLVSMEKQLKKLEGTSFVMPEDWEQYFVPFYHNKGMEDQVFMYAMENKKTIDEKESVFGYFIIITSEKMTAREALLLYKSRDASEKLFRGDKSYLGNASNRSHHNESFRAKIFIEFVALIIRNRMYVCLHDKMDKTGKGTNYLTVPAAVKELEKIEMIRMNDGKYHMAQAVTKVEKEILSAFDLTDKDIKKKAEELALRIQDIDRRKEKDQCETPVN